MGQLSSILEKASGLTLNQLSAEATKRLAANSAAVKTALYLLAVTAAWRIGGKLLRRSFVRRLTVMNELQHIGIPRNDGKRMKGTAVVCGGSIAGLWTARVCADHFEDVLVVEPEEWVATDEGRTPLYDEKGNYIENSRTHPRSRVYQYNAIHIFQPLSLLALNKLFPTFEKEMRKTDGRIQDSDYNVYFRGKQVLRKPVDDYPDGRAPQSIFASRETTERLIRRLLLEYSPRIRWMVGTAVGAQPVPGDPSRLSSVTVRKPDGREEVVPAALVVDCSGGSQVGLKWLRRIYESSHNALAPPPRGAAQSFDDLRAEYDSNQRARRFRFFVPPEARARLPIPGGYDACACIYTYLPIAGKEAGGFLLDRLEGHRIELSFSTRGDGALPEDKYAIKDFARSFGDGKIIPEWFFEIMDILLEKDDTWNEVLERKFPPCTWIHYEKAPYIPSNFVAIGDSVMRVNPVYGQGCTKAAMGAMALDGMLRSSALRNKTIPAGFGREFAIDHARKTASAWDGTKPNDYMYDTTIPCKGEKLSDEHARGALGAIVLQLAAEDKKVDSALIHVRSFLAPPTDLMQPSILVKILLFLARQKLGLV